jgi:hypothetical protein
MPSRAVGLRCEDDREGEDDCEGEGEDDCEGEGEDDCEGEDDREGEGEGYCDPVLPSFVAYSMPD